MYVPQPNIVKIGAEETLKGIGRVDDDVTLVVQRTFAAYTGEAHAANSPM